VNNERTSMDSKASKGGVVVAAVLGHLLGALLNPVARPPEQVKR
jgi:hypothetical protein